MKTSLDKEDLDVPKDNKQPKILNRMDPRIAKHDDMLGKPNKIAPVNKELIEEISYDN